MNDRSSPRSGRVARLENGPPVGFPVQFRVSGENRSDETLYNTCLAPRTAEQDVVFAVVNTGEYALAWYACLNEGTVRT